MRPWKKESCRSRAFTLVELLVVIAVIGVLVSLLLPAIQQAREVAAKASCQNKLKQLALACNLYESSMKKFPPGRVKDTGPKASWLRFTLPYIEQGKVDALYDKTKAWNHANNQQARETVVASFLCPSTRGRAELVISNAAGTVRGAVSDYVAVGRLHKDAVAAGAFASHIPDDPGQAEFIPGILNVDESVSLQFVGDGVTRTIIIGEVAGRPEHFLRGGRKGPLSTVGKGMWADDDAMSISIRGSNYPDPQNPSAWTDAGFGPCPMNCSNKGELFSFHVGSSNVAFGDASVISLSQDIDIDVLANMVTRNGGEYVDPANYK